MLSKRNESNHAIFLILGVGLIGLLAYTLLRAKEQSRTLVRSSRFPPSRKQITEHDIDLTAGQLTQSTMFVDDSTMNQRFYPVIPANALSRAGHYARPFEPKLTVTRLIKTDVNHKLIDPRLMPVVANVCALAKGIGSPFASGIILDSHTILTARHTIEGLSINDVNIRVAYEMHDWGMDYGQPFRIAGIIEDNADLDYVILKLDRKIPKVTPPQLRFTSNVLGETLFIHHPNGHPKKLSTHASFESDHKLFAYSGFHDSWCGSSGGAYADPSGRYFAMHLLFDHGNTAGRWLEDIYRESAVLQALYTSDGHYKQPQNFRVRPTTALTVSEPSQKYRDALEKKLSTMLLGLPNLGNLMNLNQARHHIVPDGDMQFLWMLGQECPKLGTLLTSMAYQCGQDSATINATEWAPWNLFIGLAGEYRQDDPGGDNPEAVKPPSFNDDLWDALQQLKSSINKCWQSRYQLTQSKKTLARYRKDEIVSFAQYDGQTQADNIPRHKRSPVLKQHANNIDEVVTCLKRIRQAYSKILKVKGQNAIHQTTAQDWDVMRHQQYRVVS